MYQCCSYESCEKWSYLEHTLKLKLPSCAKELFLKSRKIRMKLPFMEMEKIAGRVDLEMLAKRALTVDTKNIFYPLHFSGY